MSAIYGKVKSRVLVTAGPTREKIDPVRFISNYSTGIFGYAIAEEAKNRGHAVTLVSGPTALRKPAGIRFIPVESALDMRRAVLKEFSRSRLVIMAAAVSDWRAKISGESKLKKSRGKKALELVENPDILKELGKRKNGRVLVGFALETENLRKNAIKKLKEKNLDIIIANQLSGKGRAFGNKPVTIIMIDRHGNEETFRRDSKREMAKIILDKALQFKL